MPHLGCPTAFLPQVVALHPSAKIPTTAIVAPLTASFEPSSHLLVSTSDVAVVGSAPQVFEAVAPDPSLFIGMGSVVILCIAAGIVWANDVVPVSRTKLAISKSRGEVREYLDDLRTSDDIISVDDDINPTTMLVTDDQDNVDGITDESVVDNVKPNAQDGRGFERWLFSDWLNKPDATAGRQKEPALPILKDAKWNSGDNPVLVTAAIMMLGVVLASITERVAT